MIRPMRAHRTAVACLIACATIVAGCSSSKQADSSANASATNAAPAGADSAAPAAGSPAAGAPAADSPAAVADFPVYPNAKVFPMRGDLGAQSMCGHKMTLKMYEVDAADKTVIAWYKGQLSNAVMADMTGGDDASDAAHQTMVEFFQNDGSGAVTVMQMHFSGAGMQAASKTIDMDKTTIGFESFDPPLGSEYVQLVTQASAGNSAAREAAKAKIAAQCPSGN